MHLFLLVVSLCAIGCEQRLPRAPGHRLSGRVRVEHAPGIVHVLLDGERSVEADGMGDFAFADVSDGPHVISAQAMFATLEGPVASGALVNGRNFDSVYLELTPIGRVTGVVYSESGATVSGARVFVAGTPATTFSQPDGRFELERVPLGTRAVVATKDGASTRVADVIITPDGAMPVELRFSDGGMDDPTRPNELPVIAALRFSPKNNRDENPRAIPAASKTRPDVVHPGSTLVLSVEASDPEGEPLSYLWSVDKGALSGGDAPSVEWTTGNQNAEVVIVVFDPRGGSATARQRFVVPRRTIRGATLWRDEVIYSEERDDDSRDILGFDLRTGVERVVFAADNEQHGPRAVGDGLLFADQVFTFVQPIVFRLRKIDLLEPAAVGSTWGKQLTPDEGFNMDFRLYTPLTGAHVTYTSGDPMLAPTGIGLFDPEVGTFENFSSFSTAGPPPAYPCYVRDESGTYGAQGGVLYRYTPVARSFVATLPGPFCAELQVDAGHAVIRIDTAADPLLVVRLMDGEMREIGVGARSFALDGSRLAYTDERAGFTGVYVEDLVSGETWTVPVRGVLDRRVLDFRAGRLVFGEREVATSSNFYSVESLQVYELP